MGAIGTCMSRHNTISGLSHLTRSDFVLHGGTVGSASTVRSVCNSYWCMIVVLLVRSTLSAGEMIWIVFALGRRIEVHVVRGRAHWPRVSMVGTHCRGRLLATWGTLHRMVGVRSSVKGSSWVPVLDSCFESYLWNLSIFNKCKLLFDSLKCMYRGPSLRISLNQNKQFLRALPHLMFFVRTVLADCIVPGTGVLSHFKRQIKGTGRYMRISKFDHVVIYQR